MANRLAASSSPYLLQHAGNPVDWFEWGDAAFAEARDRDVPVLLSVGYSSCHWCHVMAHESFEDETTAAFMNEHFVNVKVDREERPDVDRIYMDAVQAMTGHGGWPMTVFLTPAGQPFFAGTYFPKEPRGNYPSFLHVLGQIREAWNGRRDDIDDQARRLTDAVVRRIPPAAETPGIEAAERAVAALSTAFDPTHGGFGGAPKFPQAPNLELLLRALALGIGAREHVTAMVATTLDAMAAGGIYDHLGGGFARYAVDERWLVPHFEKMLYDNALLARIYVRAWQLTGTTRYRTVAEETLDYLLRDLAHDEGGLFSAEDADSEGEEGTFYVWSWDELMDVLEPDGPVIAAAYGATERGNFEGRNVLHRPEPLEDVAVRFGTDADDVDRRLHAANVKLRTVRAARVRPGLDDKVVTAWNGLALRAFAEAGAVLESARYLDAARRIARFIGRHVTVDGRLLRSWRDGATSGPGFCDDYAAMATGLFALYQATGEVEWYLEGERLTRELLRLFPDAEGGFFATGTDAERLITRPKNLMDNPTPSDNALAAEALITLAAYTGDMSLTEAAEGVYRAAGRLLDHYPSAAGHLVSVLAVTGSGVREVAIVGPDGSREPLERVLWETFRPDCVLAAAPVGAGPIALLEGRTGGEQGALAHVCERFVCDLPVATPSELRALLRIGAE